MVDADDRPIAGAVALLAPHGAQAPPIGIPDQTATDQTATDQTATEDPVDPFRGRSDAEGFFRIARVPADEVDATVGAEGFAPLTIRRIPADAEIVPARRVEELGGRKGATSILGGRIISAEAPHPSPFQENPMRLRQSPRSIIFSTTATLVLSILIFGGLVLDRPASAEETAPDLDLQSAIRMALVDPKPSEEELSELLKQLELSPDDAEARLRLLNYYRPFDPARRGSWETHLVWLLEKHPDKQSTAQLTRSLEALPYDEAAELAKRLWLEQLERFPDDPRVHANAATFFSLNDRELAKEHLERAKELEPQNPRWLTQLAQIRDLEGLGGDPETVARSARAALLEMEAALPSMEAKEREAALPRLARYAFEAGERKKAEAWAREMLTLAAGDVDWNTGNLYHHGHLILGRLALHNGDAKTAKTHLLDAARTDGSPQLSSFGPNMKLAEELLEAGERDAVVEYLALCAQFWPTGKDRLAAWQKTIRNGGVPKFGPNLRY